MTSQEKQSKKSLSGISIALAFIALGLLYSTFFVEAFTSWTKYISGLLFLIGAAGLMIELQKLLKNLDVRLENGGVGILVLAPSLVGAQWTYVNAEGLVRTGIMLFLLVPLLLGLSAVIDLVVSIIESVSQTKSFVQSLLKILQYSTLLLSAIASFLAAINQFF